MLIDPRKQFRTALRDAMRLTPHQENFPSVMKSRSEDSLVQLETITKNRHLKFLTEIVNFLAERDFRFLVHDPGKEYIYIS